MSLRLTILALCFFFPFDSFADEAAELAHVVKKPVFELALRGGPTGWPYGLGIEVLHIAPGFYTTLGIVSAYYSYQIVRSACDEFESVLCEGKMQQYGAYYRLIGSKKGIHPWLGLGFGYYSLDLNGTGEIHYDADFIGDKMPEGSTYEVAKSETGITPFLIMGGEYAIGDRLGLGIDIQPGLRIPITTKPERKAWQQSEPRHYFTVNTGIRLSFKVY